jgi:hypothetical protein
MPYIATDGETMAKKRRYGTWEEPAELRRIRGAFSEEKKRVGFETLKGRPPHSEAELEHWFEWYTLELYNSGRAVP